MRITKKLKAEQLRILEAVYGEEKTALTYTNPFTFIVAVVLSAQCTDARVNLITQRIFPRLDSPEKMRRLSLSELETEIKDCGLYHAKAKHLLGLCELLLSDYGGEVPKEFDDLIRLPGVGRKTANVVRSVLWGFPAIAVDTHVFRVSNRLKLAVGKTPLEVETGLQKIVPKEKWGNAHHWLIWHGRRICKAQKPNCRECPLAEVCPSRK